MNIYKHLDTIIVSSLQEISINEKFLHQYFSLIDYYIEYPLKCNYEKHHILPKSLFPKYKNLNQNKWNCVKLPVWEHLEAHRLLMNITNEPTMIWSYQYMSNNGRWNNYLNEKQKIDYELSKKLSKNLIHVRNTNGKSLIVKKDNPNFLNGKLKPYHSGIKYYNDGIKNYKFHPCFDNIPPNYKEGKLPTKLSHTKGKVLCNNGKINKFFNEDTIPKSFVKGKLYIKKPKRNTGRKWYNNGSESIIIKENENIPDGFIEGNLYTKNIPAKNKNKKCYNNGKENIYIGENEKIPDGFILGGKKPNNKRSGKICINDGNINLYIDKNSKIPEGFKKGEYRKNKLPSNTKGLKWYNNGIKERMFNPLNNIPEGYVEGKLTGSTSGKKWYNNGKINKMFSKDSKIPEGFIKGKLQK